MKKIIYSSVLLAFSVLVGACTPTPKTSAVLEQVRIDYAGAQSFPNIATLAPEEMKQAAEALQQANAAASRNDSIDKIDQLANIAKQKIVLALEAANQRSAGKNVAVAAKGSDQPVKEASPAKPEAALADLAAIKTERGMVMTLGNAFGSNLARLNPEGMSSLRKLADFLQKNPPRTVLIEGFTDSSGIAAHNQKLSEQRASAVRNALQEMGVSPKRIETRGYGASYPVAANDTAQNRGLNRRVEIVISEENSRIMPR